MSKINTQEIENKIKNLGYTEAVQIHFRELLSLLHQELTGEPINWVAPLTLKYGAIYHRSGFDYIYTSTGTTGQGLMIHTNNGLPYITVSTYNADYYTRQGFTFKANDMVEAFNKK